TAGGLFDSTGNYGAVGSTQSKHLVGTSRPCATVDRNADRLAAFRNHNSSTKRRHTPFRCARPMSRKRKKGALYTSGETDGECACHLDQGTRKGWFQDPVPQRAWWPTEFRLRPVSRQQICCLGTQELPLLVAKACFTTRASAHSRHGTTSGGSRSRAHCR